MLRHMLPAQSFSTVSKIHISLYLDIRSPGVLEEGTILIRAVIVQSPDQCNPYADLLVPRRDKLSQIRSQ